MYFFKFFAYTSQFYFFPKAKAERVETKQSSSNAKEKVNVNSHTSYSQVAGGEGQSQERSGPDSAGQEESHDQSKSPKNIAEKRKRGGRIIRIKKVLKFSFLEWGKRQERLREGQKDHKKQRSVL